MLGQIRAGRQLAVADFTAMGLGTPVGLFNLSGLTNLGSGGALVNKGTVPFGVGVNGLASHGGAVRGVYGAGAVYRGYGGGGSVPDQDGFVGLLVPHREARRQPESRQQTLVCCGTVRVPLLARRSQRRRHMACH